MALAAIRAPSSTTRSGFTRRQARSSSERRPRVRSASSPPSTATSTLGRRASAWSSRPTLLVRPRSYRSASIRSRCSRCIRGCRTLWIPSATGSPSNSRPSAQSALETRSRSEPVTRSSTPRSRVWHGSASSSVTSRCSTTRSRSPRTSGSPNTPLGPRRKTTRPGHRCFSTSITTARTNTC